MKIVYRKPGGNGESVAIESVNAFFAKGKLYADQVEVMSAVASSDSSMRVLWALTTTDKAQPSEFIDNFAIQETSPSSLAIAVRRERARAAGVATIQAAVIREQARKTDLSFREKIATEIGLEIVTAIEDRILHVQYEGLGDNPWRTALERLKESVRIARDSAQTEAEMKAFDVLVNTSNIFWHEAKRREMAP